MEITKVSTKYSKSAKHE